MSLQRIAVIFDNRARPETTGLYVRRALGQLAEVEHFLPDEIDTIPRDTFDLYLQIDDGTDWVLPNDLKPSAAWVIDTHVDFAAALRKAQAAGIIFAAQKNGAAQLRAAGLEAVWLPLAADPELHSPPHGNLPEQGKRYDVAFVGHIFPGPRQGLLETIRRRYRQTFIGQCYYQEMAAIYAAARIVFNRSIADDLNMRVFEAMCSGSLLLTNAVPHNGLEELFRDGEHLVTYADEEELFARLERLLTDEAMREKIAAAGRSEVLSRHTYVHRMTRLLRLTERKLRGETLTEETDLSPMCWVAEQTPPVKCVSACLLSWRRPENLRQIVAHLREQPLIDDILIWNNDPQQRLALEDFEDVTVIDSPRNEVTYGRYLCAERARHEIIYTQDDDCLVHNIDELYETFRLDPSRLACNLKLGHLAARNDCLFGRAEMTLLGWGAFFRREWTDVFAQYRQRFGAEELLRRKADRLFSILLNRRHRPIPAQVTDLPGAEGAEALSVRDDHEELTRRAVERALELLVRGPASGAGVEVPATSAGRKTTQNTHKTAAGRFKLSENGQETDDGHNLSDQDQKTSDKGQSTMGKSASYFEHARPELMERVPADARRILDVGCGTGRLGEALKARQPCEVWGIERDARVASSARSRLHHVVSADVETLSEMEGAPFDCIICGDVLEHLRDPLSFLKRAKTWLAPGGRLVASLPNVRHHSVLRGLLEGNWSYEPAGLLDEDHLRFFTRREIEKLFFRAGWRIEELVPVPGSGWEAWAAQGQPLAVRIGGFSYSARDERDAAELFTYQYLVTAVPEKVPDFALTSIILVTHNQLAYTRACVESLRHVTEEPYELICVDNGSTDGTPEFLETIPGATVLRNEMNRGFPAAVNQGLSVARGRQILLLNNDTLLTTGWLRRLLEALYRHPEIGLAGPLSNQVSGEQQIPAGYDDLSGLDGFAWQRGQEYAGQIIETDRLVGFCLLFKREVYESIGGLDERFGLGNFEDDDFCRRAREAGYRAVIALDAFVHHAGGATFRGSGIDFAALMAENQQKFAEKWNVDSGQRTEGTPERKAECRELEDQSGRRKAESDEMLRGLHPAEFRKLPNSSPQPSTTRSADSDSPLRLSAFPVRLSLCMIVRDNEDTIRPALESVRPFVDEMIVVDTGSIDRTPDICRELGARVEHFTWCDDFAAARNASLKYARGEWIFWMDSDDVLPPECGRQLRELVDGLHPANVLGYVMQVHCPAGRPEEGMTVVDHVKLFRNQPDLRFEGRIHEQILPAIRRAGGEVAFTEIFVVHAGSDQTPAGRQRKLQRDFRLLELDLAERPDHPFVLFNLGMTHDDAGQYKQAVAYLTRCLSVSQPGESHVRKAYALLAHAHQQQGDAALALAVCRKGRTLFPHDAELAFREAMLLHETGRLKEAAAVYEELLAGRDERCFQSVDADLRGWKARHNLALVYEALGEHQQATRQRKYLRQQRRRQQVVERPGSRQQTV